jgi:uncharacterized protein YbcI
MASTPDTQYSGHSLYLAISNAIVKLLRENSGRGPTKARTTIHENVVLVMLEDTLTKGEQNLVRKGRADKVLEIRHEFQEAMREESGEVIGALTGRKVLAFMSANHLEPDLAAEIFVLDGPPNRNLERPSESTETDQAATAVVVPISAG